MSYSEFQTRKEVQTDIGSMQLCWNRRRIITDDAGQVLVVAFDSPVTPAVAFVDGKL